MAGKKKKFLELEPNWQAFFELAKQIVTENIPKTGGRLTVLEMLNYGQRLDAANTLEGDPYNTALETVAGEQEAKFSKLETKALEDIKKLADSDDPVLAKIAEAAQEFVDKEGK